MAQMTHCQDCNAPISTKANQCPKCGAPTKQKEQFDVVAGIARGCFGFAIVGVIAYLVYLVN